MLVFTTPSANPFTSQPMQTMPGRNRQVPESRDFQAGRARVFLKACSPTAGWRCAGQRYSGYPAWLSSAAEALEMMQQAFGAYRAVVADLDPKLRAA